MSKTNSYQKLKAKNESLLKDIHALIGNDFLARESVRMRYQIQIDLNKCVTQGVNPYLYEPKLPDGFVFEYKGD